MIRRAVGGRLTGVSLGLVLLLLGVVQPAGADRVPFWESPTGLVPGSPGIQVRMAAETVDTQVVERGEEIHALVQATFSMVNDGDDVSLKGRVSRLDGLAVRRARRA